MKKSEKVFRWVGIGAGELFTVCTVLLMFFQKKYNCLPLAFGTLLILAVPAILERLLRCRICTPAYLVSLLYAVGPMLGQCYGLYYLVSWWDKLLHLWGGIMFVLLGILLFGRMGGDTQKRLLVGVFALCFSMAISVTWEFIEFSSDQFLGTDMQGDTVVTSIHSYALDEGLGAAGAIEDIDEVTINGQPLPFKGYLDIGLIDTMTDMLLETLGALAAVIVYWGDRGRHPVAVPRQT